MPYISKENAQKYYNELIDIYNLNTDLDNKVVILQKFIVKKVLNEVTGYNEYKNFHEQGQKKWFIDNMEKRNKNGDIIGGIVPKVIVSGIQNLIDWRNPAAHEENKIFESTFNGLFTTSAQTISFFSDTTIPDKILSICNGKKIKVVKTEVETLVRKLENHDEINQFNEKCMIIKIRHKTILERGSIYEAVRRFWRADIKRAEQAEYVLAYEIEKKTIIGVYVPTLWYITNEENVKKYGGEVDNNRIAFIGEEAENEIKNKYLNKGIPDKYKTKSQNPVQYSYSL